MTTVERLQHRLELMGFVRDHAKALAIVLHSNGVEDPRHGIAFRLSGGVTSIYQEDRSGVKLLAQVERS